MVSNVLPLGEKEYGFYVDIYSNLPRPKSLLRFVLGFATSLTLLENLPYLRELTALKQQNLVRSSSSPDREKNTTIDTVQLYHRYVTLYSPALATEFEPGTLPIF
ncbi:MAG: hypothetical protein AAF959_02650 [Cyanobacteria bacterium P01_D01_bin.56]